MIHVIAILTTKPGQRATVLEAIRANLPAVRAEKGCIEYGPAIDAEGIGSFQAKAGPDTVFVIEKWQDADALKAHAAAPHMAAYAAKVKDLMAARVIHVLAPAA
jgi:quinol monooxygenase YgiN